MQALDSTDLNILRALEADARVSYAELGRRISLSPPAVAERVARLRDVGAIRALRALLNPEAVGRGLSAVVEFNPFGVEFERSVDRAIAFPEIVHCWRVTGQAFLIMYVQVTSNEHLNRFLMDLSKLGHTKTSIVLRVEVEDRPLLAERGATTV